MKKPTVYLAGAMTNLTQEEMTGWRTSAKHYLQPLGFDILDPTTTHFGERPTAKEIVTNNKAMIDRSDIVLMEFNQTKFTSLGTVGEAVYAADKGKPVIVWGGQNHVIYNPWVEHHITKAFPDLQEAVEYIAQNYGAAKGAYLLDIQKFDVAKFMSDMPSTIHCVSQYTKKDLQP